MKIEENYLMKYSVVHNIPDIGIPDYYLRPTKRTIKNISTINTRKYLWNFNILRNPYSYSDPYEYGLHSCSKYIFQRYIFMNLKRKVKGLSFKDIQRKR